MAVALLALMLSVGGTAYAATGGNWILGQTNAANATTRLNSTASTAAGLAVANTAGKPAANFTANAGIAPFSVSNAVKIANLNADKLDGIDSLGFITAGPCSPIASCKGSNAGGAIGILPGNSGTISLGAGLFSITYACPSTLTDPGTMTFTNTSAATENVFTDNGGTDPTYQQLAAAGTSPSSATATGDVFVWQIQHPTAGLATIHAASVNRPGGNDCHLQVQAVITRP
jgi:hypothetical protein